METASTSTRSDALRGGTAIAVAVGVMNVSTYLFTILAARLLGPQPFGAFTAVMNVLLVASVLSLALQATAARRIAREPGDVETVERTILRVGRSSALTLGAVLVLLAPVLNATLKLDSIATALLIGISIAPVTLMGAQSGVLQGERRWVALSLIYLSAGLPRLLVGVALLAWRPTELVAISAVAVGAYVPVLVGSVALRRPRAASAPAGDHTARALLLETVHNSQALLAFLALSSLDIVIARNALDPKQAGLYAAGLIMVKAVTFLPQFVVVLAFPSMGTDGDAPRRALLLSLAMVTATGLAVTLGVQVLPDLALIFVGGDDYAAIGGRLWIFALLGTVISLVQLLVYSVLARQARSAVVVLWLGLAALLAAGLSSSGVTELVTRVLLVDGVLLAVLLGFSLHRMRRQALPVG